MIVDLLDKRILIISEVIDWKHAIILSAQSLLEQGFIEDSYVQAMIDMCEKYNAYVVLADDFAMPHASSDCGVIKQGVSIAIFKNPVDFMGKEVSVMLTLAPLNNENHLLLLQEVAELFGNPELINLLKKSSSAAEVIELLKNK